MYQGLKEEFKSEAVLPWGVTTYYRATAPATTGVFTSLEPETATLDEAEPNWKKSMTDYNVMIVTLARAAGENANYTPGEDGVNPEQDLNQRIRWDSLTQSVQSSMKQSMQKRKTMEN